MTVLKSCLVKISLFMTSVQSYASLDQRESSGNKFYRRIGDNRPTHDPDITSLSASGRLQNAIKYCRKVRKTDVAGKEFNNSTTV